MNILITGGSGFIGSHLRRELVNDGHNVIITTRRQSASKDMIPWNPSDLIPADMMSNIDAVINLAGESIAPKRWTKERKERILSSRIDTTRMLVESIRNTSSSHPRNESIPTFKNWGGTVMKIPKVLISASAIGYYGLHGDEYVTEDTSSASDFLADVCKKWEAEALKAQELGVRVVLVRIGSVLEANGGALPQMIIPFKFFLGGPMGSGKQWFSWIHRDDVVGIIQYALENDSIEGPVNATAPKPVTNMEFSSSLGKTLNRPSYFAVPGFVIKLAFGELGTVFLTGRRVLPAKALQSGYTFKYSELDEALRAIFL